LILVRDKDQGMARRALDLGAGFAPSDTQALIAMFTAKSDRHGGTLGPASAGNTDGSAAPSSQLYSLPFVQRKQQLLDERTAKRPQ
jgi:hypothetical protein